MKGRSVKKENQNKVISPYKSRVGRVSKKGSERKGRERKREKERREEEKRERKKEKREKERERVRVSTHIYPPPSDVHPRTSE